MASVWTIIIFFMRIYMVQTVDVSLTNSVIAAHLGETVTLRCFFMLEDNTAMILWYKQAVGQIPRPVVGIRARLDPFFLPDFNSTRFQVVREKNSTSLAIRNTIPSDEGTYFCGVRAFWEITFFRGLFLILKGHDQSNAISVLQSSAPEPVHRGDSVTLQCSVLTERRTAELSVFWFRAASPESRPGIIYTHKNRSDRCEVGSLTQSCVYNLSKKNLSPSDAGTYYCAVATCGEILFGNGTKLVFSQMVESVHLGIGVGLGLCVVVIIGLTWFICQKKLFVQCRGREHQQDMQGKPMGDQSACQGDETEMLNYAGLHFSDSTTKTKRKRGRSPEDTIYSSVPYVE